MKTTTTRRHRLSDRATVARVNSIIETTRRRAGLWRTREQCADIKWRAHCKREGVAVARGGWREGRRHCNTKSQWQWRQEQRVAEGYRAPDETGERTTTTRDLQAVILYDNGGHAQAYPAEIERRTGRGDVVKIIVGRARVRIHAHRVTMPEQAVTTADGTTLTAEMLARVAMQYHAEIYKLEWVEKWR